MGNSGNLSILFCHTLHCIDNQDNNICLFHSTDGSHDAVSFQFFFYFIFSAKANSINQNIF